MTYGTEEYEIPVMVIVVWHNYVLACKQTQFEKKVLYDACIFCMCYVHVKQISAYFLYILHVYFSNIYMYTGY